MLSVRDVASARALTTRKLTPALARELQSRTALRKELRRIIAESRRARRTTVSVGRRIPEGSVS